MNALNREEQQAISACVLEIDVNNHPGVMSHIVGLFSRRACNVEGILCLPLGAGQHSRIWLLLNEDSRLRQMIKQVEKLEDVIVVRRHDGTHPVFRELGNYFQP